MRKFKVRRINPNNQIFTVLKLVNPITEEDENAVLLVGDTLAIPGTSGSVTISHNLVGTIETNFFGSAHIFPPLTLRANLLADPEVSASLGLVLNLRGSSYLDPNVTGSLNVDDFESITMRGSVVTGFVIEGDLVQALSMAGSTNANFTMTGNVHAIRNFVASTEAGFVLTGDMDIIPQTLFDGTLDLNATLPADLTVTTSHALEGSITAGFSAIGNLDVQQSSSSTFTFKLGLGTTTSPYVEFYEWVDYTPTKMAAPASAHYGTGRGIAWSPDGRYSVVTATDTPFISIYDWNTGEPIKIATPADLPGQAYGASWSPDGRYLAIGGGLTPYLIVYDWNTGVPVKVADPATLPASTGMALRWSSNSRYLAIPHQDTPFVTIYDWDTGTPVKVADPSTLPTGNALAVTWSPDGRYLAVGHSVSPFVTIYDWQTGSPVKKANPATLPPSTVRGAAWSPDGRYLALAHSNSPFVTIYDWNTGTPIKIANPATLPPTTALAAAWSSGGRYLAIASSLSPFVTIYDWNTGAPVKIADPVTLPAGTVASLEFTGEPPPDEDVQAIVDQMDTTPSVGRQTLINDTVVALKAAGIWSKLECLYLLAAHDAQAARVNWKTPGSFDLTEVGSLTFVADSHYASSSFVAGNYLTSGFIPASHATIMAVNSASLFTWSGDDDSAYDNNSWFEAGAATGSTTPGLSITSRDLARRGRFQLNSNLAQVQTYAATGPGLRAINRNGSTTSQIYAMGASVGTNAAASTGLPTQNMLVCAASVNGVGHPRPQRAVGWGASLTAGEHAALNTIIEAYLDGIASPADRLIAAMSPAPSAQYEAAIRAAVSAMQSAGIWDKTDGLYVFQAHSQQAALLNWKNPAETGVVSGTLAFTPRVGFSGTGTANYIDAPYNAPNLLLNDAVLGVFLDSITSPSGLASLVEVRRSSGGFQQILHSATSPTLRGLCNSGTYATAIYAGVGHYAMRRADADSVSFYHNGAFLSGLTNTSTAVPVGTALRILGGSSTANRRIGFAYYGGGFSAGDIDTLNSIMEDYKTAIA